MSDNNKLAERPYEIWTPQTARISFFGAGINKKGSQIPYMEGGLKDVFDWVNTCRMWELTQQLRSIENEKEQKAFKASMLPFVTFSGVFTYRKEENLVKYSQLMCFDFDHLGNKDNVWKVRELLENDPHFETMIMFTSPRGEGVKWVTHIDLSLGSYAKWYRAISNYLFVTYGLEADPSQKNVASACFLCWDPNFKIHKCFKLF